MEKKKRNKKLEKRLRIWLLASVSVMAIVFAGYDMAAENFNYNNEISAESILEIKELNAKYDLVIKGDLLGNSNERLMAELATADIFDSNAITTNKGLLVTMDEELTSGGIIVLEPIQELSDDQLTNIAEQYMEKIPEFEFVEIDQDVILDGWPDYDISYEEAEDLQEEVFLSDQDSSVVKIAVIDSGVDLTHEFFKNTTFETGYNAIDSNTNMYDDVSHGTHMTGIIVKTAPDAVIVPYKIASTSGGQLSHVLQAYYKAVDAKVNIINASFGVMSDSYALKRIIEKAYKNGIIIVAAAGNNNMNGSFYPAQYNESIAIASVDSKGTKMPKSNYGFWVDLATLGDKINSTLPGNKYGQKSGTSPATASMTGRIANLMMANGFMDAKSIIDYFKSSGSKLSSGQLNGVYWVK